MDDIFKPLQMGTLELQNRIVMAPMTRARAGRERVPNDMMLEYYALRADAGLIISEGAQISEVGIGWEQTPGIHTEEQIEGWKAITGAVHREGGRIFCQLWHTGRASHSYYQPRGRKPVSSSAIAKDEGDKVFTDRGKKTPETPHPLNKEEIAATVQDYREAAENALKAGFDGVEIHAANGYLIDQFLRDGVNQRDDEYGGSIENRSRFLHEVIRAVLEVCDAKRVGVRLSPTNPFNSMSDSDPETLFVEVARSLNQYDLAYLHLLEAPPQVDDHPMAQEDVPYVAPKIREVYNGTLMLNAGYDYDLGNSAISMGRADLISYGTPFIANPDLVARFAQDAELNEADPDTFYTHGEEGYLDYPMLQTRAKAS